MSEIITMLMHLCRRSRMQYFCGMLMIPIFLLPFAPPASAEFSEPILIDGTSHVAPVDKLKSVLHPYSRIRGKTCQGADVCLCVFLIELGGEGASPRYLTMVRTDTEGRLLDTIPRMLLPIARRFSLESIAWKDPYFYVLIEYDYQLCYMRVTQELIRIDDEPIPYLPGGVPRSFVYRLDDDRLWIIEYNSYLEVFLVHSFGLPDFQEIIGSLEVTPGQGEFYTAAATNGLYITKLVGEDDSIVHYFVSEDGQVMASDPIMYDSLCMTEMNSVMHLKYDSAKSIFGFLDIDSLGNYVLSYYYLSSADSLDTSDRYHITLPVTAADRISGLVYNRDERDITAVGTIGPIGSAADLSFFRFDIPGQLCTEAVTTDIIPDHQFIGYQVSGNQGFYFHLSNGNIYLFSFNIDIPFMNYALVPLMYSHGHERHPSIFVDENTLMVYSEYFDFFSNCFKIHTVDINSGEPVAEDTITPSYYQHIRPKLFTAGNRRLLTWLQSYDTGSPDWIRFREKFVFFDEHIPSAAEMSATREIPGTKTYRDWQSDHSSVLVRDTTLYLNAAPYKWYYRSDGECWSHLLHINIESGDIISYLDTLTGDHRGCLLERNDTLIWLSDYEVCLEYDILTCINSEWGYYLRKFADDINVRDITYLWYEHLYPCDGELCRHYQVRSKECDGEYLLHLAQMQQIWRLTDNDELTLVADISQYTDVNTYNTAFMEAFRTDSNYIVLLHSNSQSASEALVFDNDWQYHHTVSYSYANKPIEFSEAVYIPENGKIYYAYSAMAPYPVMAPRIYYQYIDVDGVITSADGHPDTNPVRYELSQNYPNPFNPSTIIEYTIPRAGRVKLAVYNILGQAVRILVDTDQDAGKYSVIWDGKDGSDREVASGVYFYHLEVGDFVDWKKMLLLK